MAFKAADPKKIETYLPSKLANCEKLPKIFNTNF